jgi:peptide chain release factor subunit 1
MRGFLDAFERGETRGVALFSSSRAGLWEEAQVPRPIPDLATVADQPYVLRLETLVDTYESFCSVIVDREKARIFLAKTGRIEEERDVLDEVPGRHDQGGWSQARYRRHIEEHVGQHLRHVADTLLRYWKRRRFDHLILAGPDEVLPEFERHLHAYVRRRIASRAALPMTASIDEVLKRSLAVEEAIETERERRVLERLHAEGAAGRHAVLGLDAVLDALNDGRVETVVAPFGLSGPGRRCTACGRLWARRTTCRTCHGRTAPVPDVIESAVAAALRQSARVETLPFTSPVDPATRELGALLRY